MARSFQIVEYKVAETDFFLDRLNECTFEMRLFEARNFLSAFLSASRSITFSIQASLTGLQEFEKWYEKWQVTMRQSKLSRYFLEARNSSQKVGYYPITGAGTYIDNNGNERVKYHFDRISEEFKNLVPDEDVIDACQKHFILLLEMVLDCYQTFGTEIDPEQYFSIKNIHKTGKTIEDLEEELGYPRGWTDIDGVTEDQRLQAINRQIRYHGIDHILIKYLGKNRFGDSFKF